MRKPWQVRPTAIFSAAMLAGAALAVNGAAGVPAAVAACNGLGVQSTSTRPGLAGVNGNLWLAWTGYGGGNLNFIPTTDGNCYGTKYVSPQTSEFGPSIALFNGKLWAAWTGTDSGQHLNLMSSTDGVHWSAPTKLGESSPTAPAIVGYKGALYMAWIGEDHAQQGYGHLNILATTDGVHYTKHSFASDTGNAFDSPGLTHFTAADGQDYLELAWTGTNNPSTIWAFQSLNGSNWINHTDTGINGFGPSLSPHTNAPMVMASRDINSVIQLYQSSDGRNFNGSGPEANSDSDVALAAFGNKVWMAYTFVSSQSNGQLALGAIF